MGRRSRTSEETQFLRGDIGADGQKIEAEEQDPAELERGQAREQLIRGHTFLGREFLTWLLWRTNSGDTLVELEKEPVTALFNGRMILRGLAGEATEVAVKGTLSPYSELVRIAIDRGLLVHSGRLRITHGEKVYEVTLDAEFLDFKAGQIPALLAEEEDDRISERIFLAEQLAAIVDALFAAFMKARTSDRWSKDTVKALKRWLAGERETDQKR